MSRLREGDGRGEERGEGADPRRRPSSASGDSANSGVQPRDHVDAGGHHRRGVDQRRDRRRTGHRVGQPDVERDLRRLAGRADAGGRGRRRSPAASRQRSRVRNASSFASMPAHGERAHVAPEEQEEAEQEARVADAVDDEGLPPGVGVLGLRRTRSRSADTSRARRPPSRRTAGAGCRPAPGSASRR